MQNKIKSIIKKLSKFGYHVKPRDSRHIDPVCNMEATSDLFKATHKGREYFFCSDYCQKQFQAKPDDYVKTS